MSFPFIISLFVAMAVVVAISLVAHKGINARNDADALDTTDQAALTRAEVTANKADS